MHQVHSPSPTTPLLKWHGWASQHREPSEYSRQCLTLLRIQYAPPLASRIQGIACWNRRLKLQSKTAKWGEALSRSSSSKSIHRHRIYNRGHSKCCCIQHSLRHCGVSNRVFETRVSVEWASACIRICTSYCVVKEVNRNQGDRGYLLNPPQYVAALRTFRAKIIFH